MKKIFLLFVLLCSCESQQTQQQTQNFVYIKDYRTNICYSTYGLGWSHGALTAVPCSEEVEKQIKLDAHK